MTSNAAVPASTSEPQTACIASSHEDTLDRTSAAVVIPDIVPPLEAAVGETATGTDSGLPPEISSSPGPIAPVQDNSSDDNVDIASQSAPNLNTSLPSNQIWSSNSARNLLDLTFPTWYHFYLNFFEPLTTAIAIPQVFFYPLAFLKESLPSLVPYYSKVGTQPILTQLGGAWIFVLFLELVLLSPIRGISPLPPVDTMLAGSTVHSYDLRLRIWRRTLVALLLGDLIYLWSLIQESPIGWMGVFLPWKWRNPLQALTIVLTFLGPGTRIAFLSGVGFGEGSEWEERIVIGQGQGGGVRLV